MEPKSSAYLRLNFFFQKKKGSKCLIKRSFKYVQESSDFIVLYCLSCSICSNFFFNKANEHNTVTHITPHYHIIRLRACSMTINQIKTFDKEGVFNQPMGQIQKDICNTFNYVWSSISCHRL